MKLNLWQNRTDEIFGSPSSKEVAQRTLRITENDLPPLKCAMRNDHSTKETASLIENWRKMRCVKTTKAGNQWKGADDF